MFRNFSWLAWLSSQCSAVGLLSPAAALRLWTPISWSTGEGSASLSFSSFSSWMRSEGTKTIGRPCGVLYAPCCIMFQSMCLGRGSPLKFKAFMFPWYLRILEGFLSKTLRSKSNTQTTKGPGRTAQWIVGFHVSWSLHCRGVAPRSHIPTWSSWERRMVGRRAGGGVFVEVFGQKMSKAIRLVSVWTTRFWDVFGN